MPEINISNDTILSIIKNRHEWIRTIYWDIQTQDIHRKKESIICELEQKSGYSRMSIFNILKEK